VSNCITVIHVQSTVADEAFYYLFDTPVTQNLIMWAVWNEQGHPIKPIHPVLPTK